MSNALLVAIHAFGASQGRWKIPAGRLAMRAKRGLS
jgi:hypothetical protein